MPEYHEARVSDGRARAIPASAAALPAQDFSGLAVPWAHLQAPRGPGLGPPRGCRVGEQGGEAAVSGVKPPAQPRRGRPGLRALEAWEGARGPGPERRGRNLLSHTYLRVEPTSAPRGGGRTLRVRRPVWGQVFARAD